MFGIAFHKPKLIEVIGRNYRRITRRRRIKRCFKAKKKARLIELIDKLETVLEQDPGF